MDNSGITPAADFAYYATGWIWPPYFSDVMKSMLLFFDAIALALPPSLADETIESDPVLAMPLAERGLLVNFDPSVELDNESAGHLVKTLSQLILSYPDLLFGHMEGGALSSAHWGSPLAPKDAKVFERALTARRLMKRTNDENLVLMDYGVRLLVLAVFAQALRARLGDRGIALHPITDDWHISDLDDLLGGYRRSTAAELGRYPRPRGYKPVLARDLYRVGSMEAWQAKADLSDVGTDLSEVPLDEVLDFRTQYATHYRAYVTSLRLFLASQALLDRAERDRARLDRQQMIRDQAADLRRISRTAFGLKTSTLLISLAGAAWTVRRGDPFGALLAALLAGTTAIPTPGQDVTSYTYLLETRKLR